MKLTDCDNISDGRLIAYCGSGVIVVTDFEHDGTKLLIISAVFVL